MPRGIPNAKRDETGMKWTTFHSPLAPNPKHNTTTYLKSESQTTWARNALKNKRAPIEEISPASDQRRGSNVLVIHPGSRFLRVGRASDMRPVQVLNVIARRCQPPVPPPTYVRCVIPPDSDEDPYSGVAYALQERRRYYKLEETSNATELVTEFNRTAQPEILNNDPFRVEWIGANSPESVIVGERVLKIGDPQAAQYSLRWPLRDGTFNTRNVASLQVILNDIETILRYSLKENLSINPNEFSQFSVVLVVQDLYDKNYLREMSNLLLSTMGFKQLCVQQESMAATYGAGLTGACVVNLGASCSTIACVDEGLVIPESRLSLAIGGDDITECLLSLLKRISFPYTDVDLSRSHDWSIIEDLKIKHCSLADNAVAINTYDLVTRHPAQKTRKYKFQIYNEMVLAPMCLFDIRPIDFDNKRLGQMPIMHPDVTDEIIDWAGPTVTQAMISSTKHLMPTIADSEGPNGENGASEPAPDTTAPTDEDTPMTGPEQPNGGTGDSTADEPASKAPTGSKNKAEVLSKPTIKEYGIDVPFEASKLPLDVAIYNSVRAAGSDDKMKKYLNAVLVIGGTSLVNSMDHALRSRLQGIMGPLFPGIEVQLIPPPKDVDPKVLAWKGAAVLGKMDAVNELWVTPSDWDMLGMRGLKERCFYL